MKKKMMIFAASTLIVLGGCSSQVSNGKATEANTNTSDVHSHASDGQQGKAVKEIPIGEPKEAEGMEFSMVHFEAADMFPSEKAGLEAAQADIHLEADIHATKDNKVGFGAGEWIPYLTVNYKMKNLDNGQELSGTLMPMNADDGPHYGVNLKMPGAGKYKVTLSVESPEKQNYLLHVDKGSGVEGRFWTKPIQLEWEFPYMPKK